MVTHHRVRVWYCQKCLECICPVSGYFMCKLIPAIFFSPFLYRCPVPGYFMCMCEYFTRVHTYNPSDTDDLQNGDKKSSRNSHTHKKHRYRTYTFQTFLTIPYPNTVVGHRTRPRCSFYPPHQHTHLFARYRTVNCFCTTNIHIKYRVAGQ